MNQILHHTQMSLSEKDRIESITMLNQSLASATDLQIQLKQAHWNVKGMEFIALHKLFDELYEHAVEQTDIIAERNTALGGTAFGTLQSAVENTQLRKYPVDIFTAKEHLEHLTHNFAIFGEHARNNIKAAEKCNDIGTGDLYIALSRMLDKDLWFLEAHLQK